MRFPRLQVNDLSRRTTRLLFVVALLGLCIWLAFFDSHSIYQRIQWQRDLARIEAENAAMVRNVEDIQVKLKEAGKDEVVEKIAREQYGMRRPGETIYRVKRAE